MIGSLDDLDYWMEVMKRMAVWERVKPKYRERMLFMFIVKDMLRASINDTGARAFAERYIRHVLSDETAFYNELNRRISRIDSLLKKIKKNKIPKTFMQNPSQQP